MKDDAGKDQKLQAAEMIQDLMATYTDPETGTRKTRSAFVEDGSGGYHRNYPEDVEVTFTWRKAEQN